MIGGGAREAAGALLALVTLGCCEAAVRLAAGIVAVRNRLTCLSSASSAGNKRQAVVSGRVRRLEQTQDANCVCEHSRGFDLRNDK